MSIAPPAATQPTWFKKVTRVAVPLGIVGIVILLVVPLPAPMLDVLLAANLVGAILILLTALLAHKSIDFSVFPALLLVTTLTRLALNVSSTRLILLHGDAGNVIEAFGNFVIGGNIIVGLVVFLILVVIQFAVITAGAGRVAEVSARFTLDAMPGKQMAIDADLNSGMIDEATARRRRQEIASEAEFYGAMDGASKFVKGDAIAAVVMVAINLIAGFAVGMLQLGMGAGESAQRFALLSVGDGLVSQVPALLISVASGVLVTRVSRADDSTVDPGLGGDITSQLRNPVALRSAAAMAAVIGLLPGLPFVPFAAISAILLFVAWRAKPAPEPAPDPEPAPVVDERQAALESAAMDPLRLELAGDLLDLLDTDRGGNLVEKVRGIRRTLASDLGIIVPPVRTADVDTTPAGHYAIRVFGVRVALAELPVGCAMVLTDASLGPIPGKATTDPVFGLPAVWVPTATANTLRVAGATVIDRATVLVTHLAKVVETHAAELLTRQDARTLLDELAKAAPEVAGEFADGGVLSLAELHEVLRALLREGVPIRNMERICEVVSAAARQSRTHEHLVEEARRGIGATICDRVAVNGSLRVVTFDPAVEQALVEAIRETGGSSWLALDGMTTARLMEGMAASVANAEASGQRVAIACAPRVRPSVRRMVAAGRPDLAVLSYDELTPAQGAITVDVAGSIELAEVAA